jgi:hypothetical protein
VAAATVAILAPANMAMTKYILNERGEPEACEDTGRWGAWHLNMDNRTVVQDAVNGHMVATYFIGLDQVPLDGQPPALWETEVRFKGQALPELRRHYRSRAAAVAGHEDIVNLLRSVPVAEPPRRS